MSLDLPQGGQVCSPVKQCVKCKQIKSAKSFYKEPRVLDGLTARCKQCMKADSITSYQSRKEEVLASHKEKYCAKKNRAKHLMANYGLTVEEWNQLFESQNYRCAICGSKDPMHNNGHFVVDHCHNFDFVRGILCGHCNSMIGLAKDDPDILFDAAMYIWSRPVGETISQRQAKHGYRKNEKAT